MSCRLNPLSGIILRRFLVIIKYTFNLFASYQDRNNVTACNVRYILHASQ